MGYIVTVNLIAYLLPFVTVDSVFLAGDGAVNNISQIAVQFHGGMLRTGKAAAAKDAYRHLKVAPEFLAHDIGGHFGSAKNRVQTLVDGHTLVHAIEAAGIVVALVQFDQGQIIGPVAV